MAESKEFALALAKALDSKKGRKISVLKTGELTTIAEYFVICTAASTTQVKSISDAVEYVLTEAGEPPRRREGERSSGWVLIDFGCVIVHVFMEEAREFYDLERLWADAEKIDIATLN